MVMEFSDGLSSVGHGGSGFPAVFRDVKTLPVNQVLQLTAGKAWVLNGINLPFFVTIN